MALFSLVTMAAPALLLTLTTCTHHRCREKRSEFLSLPTISSFSPQDWEEKDSHHLWTLF